MSYNFNSPCFNCAKKEECKDVDRIRKAIDEIHEDRETHKGSGAILMMCHNVEAVRK